jgi:hypothetical protein
VDLIDADGLTPYGVMMILHLIQIAVALACVADEDETCSCLSWCSIVEFLHWSLDYDNLYEHPQTIGRLIPVFPSKDRQKYPFLLRKLLQWKKTVIVDLVKS